MLRPVTRESGCSWDGGRIDLLAERFDAGEGTTAPDLAQAYYADGRSSSPPTRTT